MNVPSYEQSMWLLILRLAEWFPWGATCSTLREMLALEPGQPEGMLRSLQNQGIVEYFPSTRRWYLTHGVGTALRHMPTLQRRASA